MAEDDQFRYDLDDNISVVLHDPRVVTILSLTCPLNKDWKSLAGLLGYTAQEVQQFDQANTNAARCSAFLQDWQTKNGSTVRVFEKHLRKLGRLDVIDEVHSVLKNQFDLVGVMHHGGKVEEVVVPVWGKITLKDAFTDELSSRGLQIDSLEFVDPKGNHAVACKWDKPAYEFKGQQVTFRKKKSHCLSEPAALEPGQPQPNSIQETSRKQEEGLSLHLSTVSTSSTTHQSSHNSIPLSEQLRQQEEEPLYSDPNITPPNCVNRDKMVDEMGYLCLINSDEPEENDCASIYDDGSSEHSPRLGSRPRECAAPEVRRTAARDTSSPCLTPEWERLRGWHDLGASGAKKKQDCPRPRNSQSVSDYPAGTQHRPPSHGLSLPVGTCNCSPSTSCWDHQQQQQQQQLQQQQQQQQCWQPDPANGDDEPEYENVPSGVRRSRKPPELWPAMASETIHSAFSTASEWETLAGWHPLGNKGTKKKVIKKQLNDHLHQDGCYILTPNVATGDVVLTVTYQNAAYSFIVRKQNRMQMESQKYYIYPNVSACSIKELITHYRKHLLAKDVPVKLIRPIPYNGH